MDEESADYERGYLDGFSAGIEDEREQRTGSAAAALGRLGGQKGGPARAAALSPARRRAIASAAARMRWHPRDVDAGPAGRDADRTGVQAPAGQTGGK